ncbi:hypothetical protein [Desulfohalovibrio reitneri]|uniref:hypothetical protein n=1 Tax=Desulfohalovibrio reitneri TaxID=1307759 RepID=UPI0004A7196C|nr:hypothetical protein [Desulfohalovibrio reitneri]
MRIALFALLLSLVLTAPALAGEGVMHMFVVPEGLGDAKMERLTDYLDETAGGWTMARTRGGSMYHGQKKVEDNLTFWVAAEKGMARAIEEEVRTELGLEKVFLTTWEIDWPVK